VHEDDQNRERILHGQSLEDGGGEIEWTRVAVNVGVLHGIDIDLTVAGVDDTIGAAGVG